MANLQFGGPLPQKPSPRRAFLSRAAAACALPALVPASALGRDGAVAPEGGGGDEGGKGAGGGRAGQKGAAGGWFLGQGSSEL